jgi:hypothetical protein
MLSAVQEIARLIAYSATYLVMQESSPQCRDWLTMGDARGPHPLALLSILYSPLDIGHLYDYVHSRTKEQIIQEFLEHRRQCEQSTSKSADVHS